MTARQLFTALKARKLVVLIVPLVAAAIAAGASALLPTRWTATASVLVDSSAPQSAAGSPTQGQAHPGIIATQVEIVRSRNVALRVVEALKLHESADAQREWRDATEGRGSLKAWLADRLLGRLDVSPVHESSVIGIGYSGVDPRFAASAANAFAQSYVETNRELKVESVRLAAQWLQDRARALGPAPRSASGEITDRQIPAEDSLRESSTAGRDADAQRTLDTAHLQASLESPAARTSVIVLSPAVEPVRPSFPNWTLNIAVALGLGALVGVGIALAMESVDQRVRSEADVSGTLEVPLLATLPYARSPRRVQTRIVDQRPRRAVGEQ